MQVNNIRSESFSAIVAQLVCRHEETRVFHHIAINFRIRKVNLFVEEPETYGNAFAEFVVIGAFKLTSRACAHWN